METCEGEYLNDLLKEKTRKQLYTIGWLAVALGPLIIIVGWLDGDFPALTSISAYAGSCASVIFTSVLNIGAYNLDFYKGQGKIDFILTLVTGIGMSMVSLFPCNEAFSTGHCVLPFIGKTISNAIHCASAGVAFTGLGIVEFFIFTQGDGNPTKQKKIRNIIYRICGALIWVCEILILVFRAAGNLYDNYKFIMLEITILELFGWPWLIKAGLFLKDKKVTS